MSSHIRYWILLFSCLAITTLIGNTVFLNVILPYRSVRHILPAQYKVNRSLELASKNGINHTASRHHRSINSDSDLSRDTKNYLDKKTTAHPIPLRGEFLNAQTTQSSTTRRTRRTPKPKGPVSILTNPNVPTQTTTPLQQTTLTPVQKQPTTPPETNEAFNKAMKNLEDLDVNNTTESGKIKLLDRNWMQFTIDSMLFAAPGLGMLVGYFPMNFIVHQKGSRVVVGVALLFSSVFICLQIKMVLFGAIYVCVLRFFQGLTCSPLFAFIGTNAAQWATLKEQLTFLTLSFSSILFAPAFFWALIYLIIDARLIYEIELMHYIVAGMSLLLAILWLSFYRDHPTQHKWVNGIELNKIATGKIQNNRAMNQDVFPLLFKSISTWALFIANFGYFSAFALLVNFLPIYLAKVLKVQIDSNVSLTFIFVIICHIFFIALNKYTCGCSYAIKVRVWNTIGFVSTGILFVLLAAWPPDTNFVNTACVILMAVLLPLGLSTLGFFHSSVVYGRFFTQHIVSNMQLPFALSMTLVPLFVVFMTIENELRYWRLVFLISGAILFLSGVVFALLVSSEPASWAEHTWDPSVSYKMRDLQYVSRNEECGLLELRRLDSRTDRTHNETNVDQY